MMLRDLFEAIGEIWFIAVEMVSIMGYFFEVIDDFLVSYAIHDTFSISNLFLMVIDNEPSGIWRPVELLSIRDLFSCPIHKKLGHFFCFSWVLSIRKGQ